MRIGQRDWDRPVCAEWVAVLEDTVRRLGPSTVLVAHSLGCIATARRAAGPHSPIQAALLVAPPDTARPDFPAEAVRFYPVPSQPLGFPSILVASTNDPYESFAHAEACATAWGSRLVNLGPAGHINSDSGLGDWPAGFALLEQLLG
jgi:hypothetical protein